MKKIYTTLALTCVIVGSAWAQTIWNGPITTFTKADFADFTQAANQDRITSNVWITRSDTLGIFNIASESIYVKNFSPEDTEWAFGTTANIGSLTFDNWQDAVGSDPPTSVNMDMVVHLITDDIYIDIKFTSWTVGRNGGGFSYERSTNPAIGINEVSAGEVLHLFPNPGKDFIQIAGLTEMVNYTIYSLDGKALVTGQTSKDEKINIQNLDAGNYFLKINNNTSLTFSKE